MHPEIKKKDDWAGAEAGLKLWSTCPGAQGPEFKS
jgi:hypothetical protein